MALTAEQRRNIAIARRESRGASPRVRLSLLEAMKVEANYRNLNYGDRDSRGVLQQRRQYYPHSGENVKYDIDQYLSRAKRANRGFHGSAGALAQAVQRSAFPGRYDEHAQEARSLLNGPGASSPGLDLAGRLGASGGPSAPSQGANPMFAALLQSSNDLAAGHMPDPNSVVTALAEARQLQSQPSPQAQNLAQGTGSGQAPLVFGNASQKEMHAAKTAKQYLGTWYKWGGESPKTGFDCSGLLQYSWAKSGVKIPRTSQQQWQAGRPISKNQLRAGDGVFFEGGPGGPGHVGMYLGNGRFIESPHTGARVRVSTLAGRTDFVGARRFA